MGCRVRPQDALVPHVVHVDGIICNKAGPSRLYNQG